MRRIRKIVCLCGAALLLMGLTPVTGTMLHQWLGTCQVYFDNNFALEHVTAQARTTFTFPTGLSSSGDPETCDENVHQTCWTYRHRCHANYINVEDVNYGHFHLSFEDPTLVCFVDPADGDGSGFGRESGSDCIPANWGNEPRYLQSHVQEHWIRIWLEDKNTHQPRVFDLSEIYISGAVPIQLWFKRTDGTWWYWSNLEEKTRWDLDDYAYDLIDVRIRGANAGPGPYTIRGFTVKD